MEMWLCGGGLSRGEIQTCRLAILVVGTHGDFESLFSNWVQGYYTHADQGTGRSDMGETCKPRGYPEKRDFPVDQGRCKQTKGYLIRQEILAANNANPRAHAQPGTRYWKRANRRTPKDGRT